ncbi:hypothetical protein M758_8G012900 [Ceratodon purpureus]|uniref:Secreted protein n=1 Tax=Ceratodon purpureus TaxID=3225 RepID=A0A8T0GU69_CERPU|nr:hypothetical protein KC19_8G013700 [Ceratodon purpureus]KAG0607247.1 hypothetical protein M758_8G012900 [Ceratodon purpureus]
MFRSLIFNFQVSAKLVTALNWLVASLWQPCHRKSDLTADMVTFVDERMHVVQIHFQCWDSAVEN